MMFFVMINTFSANDSAQDQKDIDSKLAVLNGMKESGILQRAYVKIGGGTVYVIHADSFSEVRNAFRDSSLSLEHDCEIFIVDPSQPQHLP